MKLPLGILRWLKPKNNEYINKQTNKQTNYKVGTRDASASKKVEQVYIFTIPTDFLISTLILKGIPTPGVKISQIGFLSPWLEGQKIILIHVAIFS